MLRRKEVFPLVCRQKKRLIQNAKQIIVMLLIQLDLMLKNTHFEEWILERARDRHDAALEIRWIVHKQSAVYTEPFCWVFLKTKRIVIFPALNFAHL